MTRNLALVSIWAHLTVLGAFFITAVTGEHGISTPLAIGFGVLMGVMWHHFKKWAS